MGVQFFFIHLYELCGNCIVHKEDVENTTNISFMLKNRFAGVGLRESLFIREFVVMISNSQSVSGI